MQYNKSFPVIFDYDDITIGLHRGKWLPETKRLLDAHHIVLNYEELGWSDWKLGQETYIKKEFFLKDLIKKIRSSF